MFKVEYQNGSGKIVTETIKDQNQLISFVATLDRLDCYIINISTIGGRGIRSL